MSFAWTQYLEFAGECEQRARLAPKDARAELHVRLAVSRAYYAAFCIAKRSFARLGYFTAWNNGRDHSRLPDRLKELSAADSRLNEIGETLIRLYKQRGIVDYEDFLSKKFSGAEAACVDARRIVELTNEVATKPVPIPKALLAPKP